MRRARTPRTAAKRRRERGIALLVVLSTLALVGTVVAEFQYSTRVDVQLALNARDEVQAEYSALSAMRMRALLLKNSRVLEQAITTLATSFGIDRAALPPAGQLLEMLPIECGLLSAITRPAGAGSLGGEDEEGMFPGECVATSKSEHAKISLPALGIPRPGEALQAQGILLGFLSDPKLARFFEEDDESGSHADTPQELVGAIVDWIDVDKVQTGNQVGDEDRYYAYLADSYRAKNAPFDSVGELQLVHGVSDELYEILEDRVTVYNVSAQIELATADNLTIALGVCGTLTNPASCSLLLTSPAFWTALVQIRTLGGSGFMPMNVQTLRTLLDSVGVRDYDPAKLSQVFTDRSSGTWYTIEAEGSLGNARKRVRAVYQTQEGQLYYYRIE